MIFSYLVRFLGVVIITVVIKKSCSLTWRRAFLITLIGLLFSAGMVYCLLSCPLIGKHFEKCWSSKLLTSMIVVVWPIVLGTVLLWKLACHRWLKSFGVTLVVFVIGVIFFVVSMMPELSEGREKARIAACISNLKQVGLALHMYANDNGGVFPESLVDLYPEYIGEFKIFYCPGKYTTGCCDSSYPASLDPQRVSYTYTPGLSQKSDTEKVIVTDNDSSNHNGKVVNILYVDGHVETKLLLPWYRRIFSTIRGK